MSSDRTKWNRRRDYLDASIRNQVKRRDRHVCQQCGHNRDLEVDHIIPAAWGGGHDLGNLVTLCHDCHSAKSKAEAAEGTRRRRAKLRIFDPYADRHPGMR